MGKLTEFEIERIKSLYHEGKSYKDIIEITKNSSATLVKILKGFRTKSEARALAIRLGKYKLTDSGRAKLSENGKMACTKSKRCWTKPERQFKDILNKLGIGVKFPQLIKTKFNLIDDENAEVYFQFPLQRYVCDFVDEERKIVYQVNGDFWHANPLLYNLNKLTYIQKHNVRHDENRVIYLKKLGYQVCTIWESEIYWNKDLVEQKISSTRKTVNPSLLHSGNTAFDSQVDDLDWSNKLKSLWFKKPKVSGRMTISCSQCGTTFEIIKSRLGKTKYCSTKCRDQARRKVERPTCDELERMLWIESMTSIAKKLGVTANTIDKWGKSYGLNKPPIGYWAKIRKSTGSSPVSPTYGRQVNIGLLH
jgi:very-short-patch-repair endonuclease